LYLLATLVIFHRSDVSSNVLSVYFQAFQVGDFWRLTWNPCLLLESWY